MRGNWRWAAISPPWTAAAPPAAAECRRRLPPSPLSTHSSVWL